MNITFLIDGFNLYHSIEDLETHEGIGVKWLDVKTVLHSYLGAIDGKAKFNGIYFFTALRHHVSLDKPNSVARHKRYISVLESTGIQVIYGKFNPKNIVCKECKKSFTVFEEKKTDVAIASKIVELSLKENCDAIAIVSGDTDLIPSLELAKKLNPSIRLILLFPYRRTNSELKQYADQSFTIKPSKYQTSQFNGIVKTAQGEIAKPSNW